MKVAQLQAKLKTVAEQVHQLRMEPCPDNPDFNCTNHPSFKALSEAWQLIQDAARMLPNRIQSKELSKQRLQESIERLIANSADDHSNFGTM